MTPSTSCNRSAPWQRRDSRRNPLPHRRMQPRTSENSVMAKFAEISFHALRCRHGGVAVWQTGQRLASVLGILLFYGVRRTEEG
jgi:hypothetical protein